MKTLFRDYVRKSDRSISEIAKSINQNLMNCKQWTATAAPVYVVTRRNFEKITEVFRTERIYLKKRRESK